MKKNKITIINHAFSGGGSERVLCNFANLFSTKGYEVDLIILNQDVKNIKIEEKVNIIQLNKTRSTFGILPLMKYFFINKNIIIISSQRHINLIVLIAKIFTFNKCKIYIRESTCYNLLIQTEPILKKFIIKFLTPILYRFSSNIICPAEDVKTDFLSNNSSLAYKIVKLYNPIDFRYIQSESKKQNQLKIDIPKKFVVCVSRLSTEKNVSFLIDSFKEVKIEGVKLLILGEGKDRVNLEKQIDSLNLKNKIFLLGHINNPYYLVSKAMLSVSTSVVEGLPNAILESIALETPILALHSISGIEELLRNNQCGHTIDTNNPIVFGKKIEELIKKDKKMTLLNEFKKQYSFDGIGEQFEKLF